MKHLGDISKINGADIEPVDLITFGSPCQDLSVAGKRAGMKHEAYGDGETTRSGLFMEAVRIIKEMREATNGKYPRFALWENVPGAFSSNKGEDFRIVLEELIKIIEPEANMPAVPKAGWAYADSYSGHGWSLAYRTFDAQYWGVPQRRRRIYLVADFGSERAKEILFKREGLRGNYASGGAPWQRAAADAEGGVGAADSEKTSCYGLQRQLGGVEAQEELAPTILAAAGESGNNKPCVAYALDQQGGKGRANFAENVMPTMCSDSHGTPHAVAYGISSYDSNAMKSANPHSGIYEAESSRTLDLNGGNPACNQGGIAIVESVAYESHPMDSRIKELEEVSPTVSAKWHKGAADTPLVCTATQQMVAFAQNQRDEIRDLGDKAGALQAQPGMKQQTFIIDSIGGQAESAKEADIAPTLKATHYKFPPSVVMETAQLASGGEVAGCLMASGYEKLGAQEMFSGDYTVVETHEPETVYATDIGFFSSCENVSPSLLARGYKDPHLVTYPKEKVQYIVRRLTPIECARLQGFPDGWGKIYPKEFMTPDEYKFWLEVRKTHAKINGKQVRDYTEAQMLAWYNKLHTDSAEYKMWGNGIALPTALYCMEGIAEELNAVHR